MTKIAVFAGTRPELIKLTPVVEKIVQGKDQLLFVHTGQHYDYLMSSQFITELSLPKPDWHLNVGSSTPATQTARIFQKTEKILAKEKPDYVLVEGDTNSVLGVALASAKAKVPLGHVEAGCRSFDKSMPEELNRVIVADCATLHFAPTRKSVENLRKEGIIEASIFLTGHPIVDLITESMSRIDSSEVLTKMGLSHRDYGLLTVHREENSDFPDRLQNIIGALDLLDQKIVFPVHPRTKKNLQRFHISLGSNVIATEPLGYFETLALIKNARTVITDSGGIQQEACILQTPCITVRDRTEWVETVEADVNILSGADKDRIVAAFRRIERDYDEFTQRLKSTKGIFGDGNAATRILNIIHSTNNQ